MKQLISIFLASILIASCGIYSFTGASIPNDAKTVYVASFKKIATKAPSSLNQTITEGLKDLFLSQTDLYLTDSEGNLNFSGEITQYQISPMAIQANETAAKNRLTISIKVKYRNSLDNKQNFESTFKRYRDFSSFENFVNIEDFLIEEISKEILEDIFNKAFVNW